MSRYEPHEGKQETRRRRLQIERAKWLWFWDEDRPPGVRLYPENRGTPKIAAIMREGFRP